MVHVVTSLTEYQPDKNLVYSVSAGAKFDAVAQRVQAAPNSYLNKFKWGAKELSVEIQVQLSGNVV